MSGPDLPPGPDPSGGEYPASPPPDPGDTDPLSEPPADPYPTGAGDYPPETSPYPPGADPYPPAASPYPPGAGSYPVPPAAYPPPPPFGAAYPFAPPQTGHGYAIAALVLGLVSLILSWFPGVDWVLAALAIIFGAVGISTAGRRGGVGRGMAMAGLVSGCRERRCPVPEERLHQVRTPSWGRRPEVPAACNEDPRRSPHTTRLTIRSGTATTLRGGRPASSSTTRG
jgi:hypothetical protein